VAHAARRRRKERRERRDDHHIGLLAPGVFGFYTATRGRASTAWLDDDGVRRHIR